jgi:hypothetical protein
VPLSAGSSSLAEAAASEQKRAGLQVRGRFESTVKDAGMKTGRSFELTAVEAPRKIRRAERSKNMVTAPDGGYDLEEVSENQTKVTIRNTFEGHGFGKLIVGIAVRAAIKGAPALAQRIKSAVEAF